MSFFSNKPLSLSSTTSATASPFSIGGSTTVSAAGTAAKDIEIKEPPSDTVSALRFSPNGLPQKYLAATSWDNSVRIWEILDSGDSVPKAQQTQQGPILDACWASDGAKLFTCGADKGAYAWDLGSQQFTQVAQHDAAIKTIHYVQAPNYTCLLTGGWDKKLKMWDMRSAQPVLTFELPERCYCAAVHYPLAVAATAGRHVIMYNLEGTPSEYKRMESPLKYMSRCLAIYLDKTSSPKPSGYALGCIEGRVAIQSMGTNPKDSFTFKCHRNTVSTNQQDVYPVNDLAFHPQHHMTLSTVGSDGKWTFWDKDARTRLSGATTATDQPISCCTIDPRGQVFAYAFGYDWSKGHEFNDPNKKPKIMIRPCADDMKPQPGKK